MMFARSVDETGATLAVVSKLTTVPVLLVSWVKGTTVPPASPFDIALGAGFLVLFSFVVLLVLRLVVRGRR
jgi:ABC-type sulfate transport system permease component